MRLNLCIIKCGNQLRLLEVIGLSRNRTHLDSAESCRFFELEYHTYQVEFDVNFMYCTSRTAQLNNYDVSYRLRRYVNALF